MGKSLSAADVQRYRQDGYLCSIPVLAPEAAAHSRARLETAEAAAGGSLSTFDQLARNDAVLDAVEGAIASIAQG